VIEPPYAALEALLRQGRAPEAEHAARVRLAAAPADGVLWRLLGAALLEQRKDALGALERAADLLRGDAAAQAMLGAALHQRGRMPEAAIRYGRALDLEPGLAEVHNNLGNVLLELGRPADAVGCFERAARLAPDDAVVLSNLCNASRLAGRLEDAVAQGERAVALAPQLAAAHNHLGNALAAGGRRGDALSRWRRASSKRSTTLGLRCAISAGPAKPCNATAAHSSSRRSAPPCIFISATRCSTWVRYATPPRLTPRPWSSSPAITRRSSRSA
jgi:tetratricopeptide (TPR) repeat protein